MSVAQYLLKKDQLKYFSPFEKDFKMRLFHPANILIVSRDLWIILLSKIWFFSNSDKHKSKNSKILSILKLCLFFPALVVLEFLAIFSFFPK